MGSGHPLSRHRHARRPTCIFCTSRKSTARSRPKRAYKSFSTIPVGCVVRYGRRRLAVVQLVPVVLERAGSVRARCALDGAVPGLWQEVPLWMFDRVACAGMRVEERVQVDLSTLSALASLVSDALGKSVASRAGWVFDDQDWGETHARPTQGSSQARERVGVARSVRPGGEQQSSSSGIASFQFSTFQSRRKGSYVAACRLSSRSRAALMSCRTGPRSAWQRQAGTRRTSQPSCWRMRSRRMSWRRSFPRTSMW